MTDDLCTYGTYCICQLCARAGGNGESVCVHVSNMHFWRCMHVGVRVHPLRASCMLGLPAHRKYCQEWGTRWLACSGNEAHTLWCVLSLQWRGSSNKVQKEKTAQEKGRCVPRVCVCVFWEPLCASTMSTSSQPSLLSRGCCSIKRERLQLSNQTQVNSCSQAWMSVQVQRFKLPKVYCVKLYMRQIITAPPHEMSCKRC